MCSKCLEIKKEIQISTGNKPTLDSWSAGLSYTWWKIMAPDSKFMLTLGLWYTYLHTWCVAVGWVTSAFAAAPPEKAERMLPFINAAQKIQHTDTWEQHSTSGPSGWALLYMCMSSPTPQKENKTKQTNKDQLKFNPQPQDSRANHQSPWHISNKNNQQTYQTK